MLSPLTLLALQRHTCVRCENPLTGVHAYPLLQPGQVISLTSELGPMHRHCAEEHAEDLIADAGSAALRCRSGSDSEVPAAALPLRCIALVHAAPHSPSARIIRLHPQDIDSTTLVLFSPQTVQFHHVALHGHNRRSMVIRPATNAEVFDWLNPAIQEAMLAAKPGTDEYQELTHTLGRIQKLWIQPEDKPLKQQIIDRLQPDHPSGPMGPIP